MRKTLSVLVPVYNERATVLKALERVRAVKLDLALQIIVVDDGSTDGTRELLQGLAWPGLTLVLHERNQGKTGAVRTALERATGDYVIVQDADLEYDPVDFPQMLQPLIDGRADVVYGSRFLGGPHRVLLFWHYFANHLFTLMANVLYNINLTDMGTCYKAFLTPKFKAFSLESRGFGMEAEITAKICKLGMSIYEVPISYSGRTYAEGKKITWKDAFSYIWCLLKYRVCD